MGWIRVGGIRGKKMHPKLSDHLPGQILNPREPLRKNLWKLSDFIQVACLNPSWKAVHFYLRQPSEE